MTIAHHENEIESRKRLPWNPILVQFEILRLRMHCAQNRFVMTHEAVEMCAEIEPEIEKFCIFSDD